MGERARARKYLGSEMANLRCILGYQDIIHYRVRSCPAVAKGLASSNTMMPWSISWFRFELTTCELLRDGKTRLARPTSLRRPALIGLTISVQLVQGDKLFQWRGARELYNSPQEYTASLTAAGIRHCPRFDFRFSTR